MADTPSHRRFKTNKEPAKADNTGTITKKLCVNSYEDLKQLLIKHATKQIHDMDCQNIMFSFTHAARRYSKARTNRYIDTWYSTVNLVCISENKK